MRDPDLTLSLTLAEPIAEVGTFFEGQLVRDPALDDGDEPGEHRIQGVRVELIYETEGRGDTATKVASKQEFPVDEWGRLSTQVRIPVPADGPVSYDGRLIRVRWMIKATTMVKRAFAKRRGDDVLVVPKNGIGVYQAPLPLWHQPPRRRRVSVPTCSCPGASRSRPLLAARPWCK